MTHLTLSFLFIAASIIFLSFWLRRCSNENINFRGDVLLVFAHPDDECMFFTPTLKLLQARNIRTHFLCLSNGDAAGHGHRRELELLASAKHYGVDKKNVKVVNNPYIRDGMLERWPLNIIHQEIMLYLNSTGSISTVITFDQFGISGHLNHIAVHHACKDVKDGMPPGLLFFQLHTRRLVLKYTGALSLIPYLLGRDFRPNRNGFVVVNPPLNIVDAWQGLRQHASQLAWFRYLFVFFSSYSYVNELSSI